jgi:hypothetical protein
VTDLIHRRTRNAFRETCSDASVVRQIEQAFENEGFDPADDQQAGAGGWYSPGQRRGTFDRRSYLIYHEMLHHLLPLHGHDRTFRQLESRWINAVAL